MSYAPCWVVEGGMACGRPLGLGIWAYGDLELGVELLGVWVSGRLLYLGFWASWDLGLVYGSVAPGVRASGPRGFWRVGMNVGWRLNA